MRNTGKVAKHLGNGCEEWWSFGLEVSSNRWGYGRIT